MALQEHQNHPGNKTFIPLENNPEVMTSLAHKLGLESNIAFHDLYSLTDPDLLALIPRPALALLFVYPGTEVMNKWYDAAKAKDAEYGGSGSSEPVMFYKQTIKHACGLIGLLHCITNYPASSHIIPKSDLATLLEHAIPLKPAERGQLLHDSEILEKAHAEAAAAGDSAAPPLGEEPGHGFIAYLKDRDGDFWELDGGRKGPIKRGTLEAGEDVLSGKAIRLGPLPYLERERNAGNGVLNFSCTVLAPTFEATSAGVV